MLDYVQALITEWGLVVAALACLAGAGFAFAYIPVFGRYAAACLVAAAAGLASYDLGYHARGALDKSGAIQAQLDEASRQLAATHDIEAAAAAREQADDANAAKLQGEIDDYEKRVAALPAQGGCALIDDDVRSLSDIGRAAEPPLPPRRPVDLRPAGPGSQAR
jgi:hypothetical protein